MKIAKDFLILAVLLAAFFLLFDLAVAVDDFRATERQATATLVQLNSTLAQTRKSIADTSSNLNASLIHLDLILGRVERASRAQEELTNKSLLTLDRTNALLIDLTTTSTSLRQDSAVISSSASASISSLNPVLANAAQATAQLDSLLSSPEIPQTLSSISAASAQLTNASAHVSSTTAQIDSAVHAYLHPSLATRIATWALRILSAAGKIF